jgi:hypothetical protein
MPDTPNDEEKGTALPVTKEVGGEGGSYADAIAQAATHRGSLSKNDRPEPDGSSAPPGAVAGAVHPNPEAADDGVHLPDSGPVEHPD